MEHEIIPAQIQDQKPCFIFLFALETNIKTEGKKERAFFHGD
jgi:hypothetical protein